MSSGTLFQSSGTETTNSLNPQVLRLKITGECLWPTVVSQRHEHDGMGVRRIRTFPFSSDSVFDSITYDPVKVRLPESEAEAEG